MVTFKMKSLAGIFEVGGHDVSLSEMFPEVDLSAYLLPLGNFELG